MDFNIDFIEAGQEYIEKIKVDVEKQTELFQVPSHPGVDRSDVLRDFKHVSELSIVTYQCLAYPRSLNTISWSISVKETLAIYVITA